MQAKRLTSLCILSVAFTFGIVPARALPHIPASAESASVAHQARYVCGMFEGRFGCRYEAGDVESHGKSSIPNTGVRRAPEQPPPAAVPAPPSAAPAGNEAQGSGCQAGMVGTPPDNCRCPPNSELLGGNCVRYTARCNKGLAADAPLQACPGAEEKLACKARQDGLQDCCCLTYSKW